MMNSALIAIDPSLPPGDGLANFCRLIRQFQERGYFSRTLLASFDHHQQHMVPMKWYEEMRGDFTREKLEDMRKAVEGRFGYSSIRVLESSSSVPEDLVRDLSEYAESRQADVLVVREEASGLFTYPDDLVGTVAEAAKFPVLFVKDEDSPTEFADDVHIVVGVDVSVPVPESAILWIIGVANVSDALVEIVYVEPRPTPVIDSLLSLDSPVDAEQGLSAIQARLEGKGIRTKITVLNQEGRSIGETIVAHAEERKAWLTVALDGKKSMLSRILLKSSTREILTLTKRPFLYYI